MDAYMNCVCRRRSEAVIRKKQRQDRRMQELQDFNRLQFLEAMRHQDKEARSKEKRRARTLSTGAAETGEYDGLPSLGRTGGMSSLGPGMIGVCLSAGSGLATPKTSVGGLMQRLAIPQRLKDLARRRRSLQPGGSADQDADVDGDDAPYLFPPYLGQRRRSPSFDPVTGMAPPYYGGADPYRTHTAGESLLGAGFDPGQGRRDSIFSKCKPLSCVRYLHFRLCLPLPRF